MKKFKEYKYKYTISELISKLAEIKEEEGDLNCVFSIDHEYWGSIERYLSDDNVDVGNGQPEGPKSGLSEKCVLFKSYF